MSDLPARQGGREQEQGGREMEWKAEARRGGGLSGEAAAYGHTRYAHMHAYLHIDLSYKHASTKAHSFATKCTYANF